jgi:hypothetical protein
VDFLLGELWDTEDDPEFAPELPVREALAADVEVLPEEFWDTEDDPEMPPEELEVEADVVPDVPADVLLESFVPILAPELPVREALAADVEVLPEEFWDTEDNPEVPPEELEGEAEVVPDVPAALLRPRDVWEEARRRDESNLIACNPSK